jgi:hypothetical protein
MGKLAMLEISTEDLFGQILEDINKYSTEGVDVKINGVLGELILATKKYKLEVLVNRKWIGYDFLLNKELTGGIAQGSSVDTDLYALNKDIEFTKKIFEETRYFVNALLSNKLYYGVIDRKAVFAKPAQNNSYALTFAPRRRFLAIIRQEVWPANKVKQNANLICLDSRA